MDEEPILLISKYYDIKSKELIAKPEWAKFAKSAEKVSTLIHNDDARSDIRFNAIHWALDVISLCRQICYGNCWLGAYSGFYKDHVKKGDLPSNVDFHTTYHVDNTITRISSVRDKLGLMIWAYYCAFNPEKRKEVLIYKEVYDRMKHPSKYEINSKIPNVFIESLERLNESSFVNLINYRHAKIHRLEPRVEIYGVEKHHGLPYKVQLKTEEEIEAFRKSIKEKFGTSKAGGFTQEDIEAGVQAKFIRMGWEQVEESCTIDGVIYDDIKPKLKYWSFGEIESEINIVLPTILEVCTKCFETLLGLEPFIDSKSQELNK